MKRFVLLASAAVATLSACGSGDTRKGELAYVERPVEQIYNEALKALDARRFEQAALQFDEVERQHPYSVWAQRATLMAAYTRYRERDFDTAISSAQEYITLHPGGDGAAYAYYLIAVCHFDQIIDVGREQGRSELALASLNEVTTRFPESEYARDAELKTDMVRDQLAGKEMEIGRYYLRRDEHLAAINRFKRVIEIYDTTTHVPEALHRLVEAYLSIGLTGQAQAAAAVLGYNYPGSTWYGETYALMEGKGLRMATGPGSRENSVNWISWAWDKIFPGAKAKQLSEPVMVSPSATNPAPRPPVSTSAPITPPAANPTPAPDPQPAPRPSPTAAPGTATTLTPQVQPTQTP